MLLDSPSLRFTMDNVVSFTFRVCFAESTELRVSDLLTVFAQKSIGVFAFFVGLHK